MGAQAVKLCRLAARLIPQVLELGIILAQLALELGNPAFQLLRLS